MNMMGNHIDVEAHSYLDVGLNVLAPLFSDDLVEISINPDCGVWYERRGDSFEKRAPIEITADQALMLAEQIANKTDARMSKDLSTFSVSLHYRKWLIRAQVLRNPAVDENVAISMRFFNPQTEIFPPKWLYNKPISSSDERRKKNKQLKEMAAKGNLEGALDFCVREKRNLVVSGGTNSGKTMVARYLLSKVSDEERIITIENAPDLLATQPNKVQMVSVEDNTDAHRAPGQMLKACLRMRPDRIILSEIRGEDAYTFLKAINTGHGGSITTLHADTAELAVTRLAQAALEADTGMSFAEMKRYIAQSIDVIVHTANVGGQRGILEFFLPGDKMEDLTHA